MMFIHSSYIFAYNCNQCRQLLRRTVLMTTLAEQSHQWRAEIPKTSSKRYDTKKKIYISFVCTNINNAVFRKRKEELSTLRK
jgi:uncharacterized C2H2 Zn-finger protein